ncbi:MAG: DUF1326 domain-containing protein, partial [Sediminibacterium sp.]
MKSVLLVFAFIFFSIGGLMSQTWSIDVDYAESCECDAPCPCLIGGNPTHRNCTGNSIVIIKKGHYGAVNVDGLKMLVTFALNDWTKVYVDQSSTQAQIDALTKLLKQP